MAMTTTSIVIIMMAKHSTAMTPGIFAPFEVEDEGNKQEEGEGNCAGDFEACLASQCYWVARKTWRREHGRNSVNAIAIRASPQRQRQEQTNKQTERNERRRY